ncbi:MAG: hypothetical protein COV44_10495 [Deltaproteobacteria bacterium CG11_big_fil_rev_8_21_14_0_20_45_16]|nr:MAG: hypothetical protein COV44_10495 [Deltaproteobacteria bacterium CG11_big_fil_rev_8_21_14_0_20_45_16]
MIKKPRNTGSIRTSEAIVQGLITRRSDKKPSILIIDDDKLLLNVYRVLLEREGYRVLTAEDGLSGLELLKKEKPTPALTLVDCSMPKMDGESFLKKLQMENPEILVKSKVVGLTAFDPASEFFIKIRELAFDCREKPFGINGIKELVSEYLKLELDSYYPHGKKKNS